MSQPSGPSMQLGDGGGPGFAKGLSGPNLSIGKLLTLPVKLLTNPLEGLRSLASLAGGQGNPIDKVLASTGKLTSLLKGNPKILLDEAMGGGKGGGLVAQSAAAAGSALQKGAEVAGDMAGKGAGVAGDAMAKMTGSAVAAIPIPIVAQAVGVGISATGPVINQALQAAGKMGGKVVGQLLKQITKAVANTVNKLVKTVVRKGIENAVKHGPCKAVGKRSIQGKKPGILSPARVTKAIVAQVRRIQRGLIGDKLKQTNRRSVLKPTNLKNVLKKTLQTTNRYALKPAGVALRSSISVSQSSSKLLLKTSEAQKGVATGRPDQALQELRSAGSASRSTVSGLSKPGSEIAGFAWGKKQLLKAPFKKAAKKTLGTAMGKGLVSLSKKSLSRLSSTRLGRASKAVSQGLRTTKQTISKPFKWAQSKVNSIKQHPVVQSITKGFRIASKPVQWSKTAAGTTSHLTHGAKGIAQSFNQVSGASKALSQGEVGQALDQAHSGSSMALDTPVHVHSAANRLTRGNPAPPRKPTPPNGGPSDPQHP